MTRSTFELNHLDHLRQHEYEEARLLPKEKFKKIYKDAKSRKKEEKKPEDKLPVHLLFSNYGIPEKKEAQKKLDLQKATIEKKSLESFDEKLSSFIDEEKEHEELISNTMADTTKQSLIAQTLSASAIENAVSQIDLEQVIDLFQKMAGAMTVMTSSGISQTTITLNSPLYASSLFYGAQIIISEYSTAPKAFNIQFVANSEAIALFHRNAKDLMAAFEGGDYNFKVNRLETNLVESEPYAFQRKEQISSDEEEKS